MARTWANSVGPTIDVSIGACGSAGYGTLACVFYVSAISDNTLFGVFNSSDSRHSMYVPTSGNLGAIYNKARTTGGPSISANKWYLGVATKASGNQTPRLHAYDIAAGTWSHANASSGTEADATTLSDVKFGRDHNDGNPLNGDIALAAIWAGYAMSDAEVENLASLSVEQWMSTSPSGLWLFDQQNVTTAVNDRTGNGANQTNRNTTTVSTRSVPGLYYGDAAWRIVRPQAGGGGITGTGAVTISAPTLSGSGAIVVDTGDVAIATPGVLDGVSALDTLEGVLGQHIDVAQIYQPWGASAASGSFDPAWNGTLVAAIIARGTIPLISWEPTGVTSTVDAADATTVTNGDWDSYIDTWIAGVDALAPALVYLRPWHEINESAHDYGSGGSAGNTAAELVAAWQYVVNRFAAASCTNVRWVWSLNEVTWQDEVADTSVDCYPGDSYVDIVAYDAYNWGSDRLSTGGWRYPRHVLERSLHLLEALAPSKPIWIAEVASSPNGGDKDEWVKGLAEYLRGRPSIARVSWFNYDNSGSGEADWRVTTPADVLTAYQGLVVGTGTSSLYPAFPTAIAPSTPATPQLELSGSPIAAGADTVTWTTSDEATILFVLTVNSYSAGTFLGCLSFTGSSGDDNSTANGLAIMLYADAASLLIQRKVGTDELDFSVPFPSGTKRLVSIRFSGGEAHVRINGLHAARDSYDSTADFAPANYAVGYRLVGNFPYNAGDVSIEAIEAYNAALSEDDLAGVETYLMGVHGIVSPWTISGTGALSIAAPALTASGTFTTTGAGSVTIGPPAVAGSGTFTTSGSGAVSLSAPAVSGAGTFTTTGSGSVTITAPAVAAAGTFATTGTGALTIGPPALAASGTATDPGTGSGGVTIAGPALAGSGTFTTTGSGAVAISAPAISGSGTFTTTGSGAVSIAAPSVAGSGSAADPGTGSGGVTIPGPALAGEGTFTTTGSGALSIGTPALDGSGTYTPEAISGDGAISIGAPAVSASGTSGGLEASGSVTIGPPALSGSGVVTISATGAVAIQGPALAGAGTFTVYGEGGVTIPGPSLHGTQVVIVGLATVGAVRRANLALATVARANLAAGTPTRTNLAAAEVTRV